MITDPTISGAAPFPDTHCPKCKQPWADHEFGVPRPFCPFDAAPAPELNRHIFETAKHDWPEDFSHENGNYNNRCTTCGVMFAGHKRRVTCKVCAAPTHAPATPTPTPSDRKRILEVLKRIIVVDENHHLDVITGGLDELRSACSAQSQAELASVKAEREKWKAFAKYVDKRFTEVTGQSLSAQGA